MKRCMGCMELYEEQYDICPHCGYEDGYDDHQLLHIDAGQILADRYVIGRSLGFGGFGVTYLGWDNKLERKVAIKEYLPSEFATRMVHRQEIIVDNSEKKTKQFLEGKTKFLKEAQKLAKVGDIDGIVHMYDSFEANNTAYIIMEYLQGETLAKYLENKEPMKEQEVMDMMLPIFSALEKVHEKGIIHRDIAPDNLFVANDEEGNRHLKLIDFGASKFSSSSHSKSLTVMIKPGYSPEEQYRSNGDQGTYTDVYALAAVMYRMVTGVQPPDSFERRTAIESHKRDLLEEPDKFNKSLSANFINALMNALNVRIEDRTATIADFEAELISFEPVKRRGSSIRRIDFMKWPIWAKIGVPVGTLAAAGLLVFAITKVFGGAAEKYVLPNGYTRIPDFVMSDFETEAQQWAQEAGLTIAAGDTRFSPIAAAGLVLAQDKPAGSIVNNNTLISLSLSTGEETFVMPDVTGMRLEDAKKALECMGAEVLTTDGMQAGLVPGGVISQDVEAYGEIGYGKTVTLTINAVQTESVSFATGSAPSTQGLITLFKAGPQIAAASGPVVVDLTYEEALEKASQEGWSVYVKERCAGKGKSEGTILEQKLSEYEGDSNVLELSVAMPDKEFELPNLMYKDSETVIQLLKNLGLEVEIKEETSEIVSSGLIISQSIDGKEMVTAGSKISVVVSSGSKPFEMPMVAGSNEEDAKALLNEKNLVANIEYAYDESIPEGTIISQSITEGTEVTRGTDVTIVICSREGLVDVPNVAGMTADAAAQLLKEKKLDCQIVEQESTEAKDLVIAQLPGAGSTQKEGTSVVITVSKGDLAVVASVVGQGYDGAKGSLESLGFKVSRGGEEYSDSIPQGSVISQSISGGSVEKKGTSISLTVSKGSNQTADATTTGTNGQKKSESWHWSDWSESAPAGAETESRTVTQYRYRTATVETTESESPSLDGYTQTGSRQVEDGWGDWSGWSDMAENSSNDKQVETQTWYSYRDNNPTPNYDWGNWSGWQDAAVSPSDTRHVNTREVDDTTKPIMITKYRSWYWTCVNPNDGKTYYSKQGGDFYFGTGEAHEVTFDTYDAAVSEGYVYIESYQVESGQYEKKTQYQYQDYIIVSYTDNWGSWSSYGPNAVSSSDTRQVNTKTYYRSCNRKYKTIYSYQRTVYGDWSEYSESLPPDGTEQQTRSTTEYRYKIYD